MDAFEIGGQVSQSSRLIEDSYIVTFREPVGEETRIVKAPNKNKNNSRKGKIPFSEPSTGQSKRDIADQLELDGEIIGILVSTNAIFVKMNAKEAYRLSRDKRVLRVDQNMTGSLLNTQADPGWGLDRLDEQTATLSIINYSSGFEDFGWNISAFAPGVEVSAINQFGDPIDVNGTSFAAPYIAGIFAIACEAATPLCETITSAAPLYESLRGTSTVGTVTSPIGGPLTGSPSIFISQQW